MSGWLFDLGNTRLKCAPLHGDGSLGPSIAIDHDGGRFVAGWRELLPAAPVDAWVCSVGPAALGAMLDAELRARGATVAFAESRPCVLGITVAYAEPRRLGTDRLLAMAAAHARSGGAVLVVGVGTALTVDLVDADGRHQGGRIAPSPTLMRAALHGRAAQLPVDGGVYVEFARDTGDALASGCLGAAVGLIERSLREAGPASVLWLHGGGAVPLLPLLPSARHAPALVLEGLALWARAARAPR